MFLKKALFIFSGLFLIAAQLLAQKPPRLLEAHYRARLDGAALVGDGRWIVLNPGATPALLPLSELNLALRSCTWDDRPGLVADFDGKTPALTYAQLLETNAIAR